MIKLTMIKLMMIKVVTNGATRRARLQSSCHHQQSRGQMLFLSPIQQCQSAWGKSITRHRPAHHNLTWCLPTLSLTTKCSSLPWGGLPSLSSELRCQYSRHDMIKNNLHKQISQTYYPYQWQSHGQKSVSPGWWKEHHRGWTLFDSMWDRHSVMQEWERHRDRSRTIGWTQSSGCIPVPTPPHHVIIIFILL